MTTLEIFLNALAVLGAMLLLFGFYRVNIGKWDDRSFWYELDNLLGATFLVIYQLYYHAYCNSSRQRYLGRDRLVGADCFYKTHPLTSKAEKEVLTPLVINSRLRGTMQPAGSQIVVRSFNTHGSTVVNPFRNWEGVRQPKTL